MPIPTFAPVSTGDDTQMELTRTQIAARLGLHIAAVDKIIRAGILQPPYLASEVSTLARRKRLQVLEGQLTVLRTDARAIAHPGENRQYIGFHTTYSDREIEETSLRWWRSTPEKVLDNELFAVTVGSFPVALYWIKEHLDTITREDEEHPRHQYGGQLLARVHPGMKVRLAENIPGHLKERAKQVMDSRIVVNSGGPIGYLDPGVSVGDLIQAVQSKRKFSITDIAEVLQRSPKMVEKAINGKAGFESWRKPLTDLLETGAINQEPGKP